ncbi:MAG: PilZ domain-containing protein [Myxococcales bacterium]|nr:PilZ domain-containing protein [Myxococcales bacterium]
MIENRQHPRFAVALECEISDGEVTLRGRSHDVSRGGISLSLAQPIELSSVVTLHIALVFGDDSVSEPLQVKAVVVWCTRLGGGYQVGAKFAPLTKQTEGYLDAFMKFLDGSLEGGDSDGAGPPPDRSTR